MNYFKIILTIILAFQLVHAQNPPPLSENGQQPHSQEIAFVQPTIVNPQNSIIPQIVPNSISPQVVSKLSQSDNNQNSIKIQPDPNVLSNQNNQSEQQQVKRAKQQSERVAHAEQVRRAYLQRQRQDRQASQEQQLKKLQADGQISKTQKKKQQQRLKFKRQAKKVELGTKFTQHLFELTTTEQFLLKVPVTQQVAMSLYTYISQDNTYVRAKDIQTEVPVKIFIYEDNQRVVYHGQFYYQIYITFEGRANCSYTIRTFNEGQLKLISMSLKKIIQQSHVQASITDELARFHSKRTQNLALQIHRWFLQFRRLALLDFQDMKQIQQSVKKYYLYEIVQTFTGIILCFIQVKMIQKMLKGNTII